MPLCADEAWQAQPGYQQFSGVARWVIDPADGANFMSRLATKKFLIQEVVDDQVVPNFATDIEGALAGLIAGHRRYRDRHVASVRRDHDDADDEQVGALSDAAGSRSVPRQRVRTRVAAAPLAGTERLRPPPASSARSGLQTDAITFLGLNH